jgi:hypothetical protein
MTITGPLRPQYRYIVTPVNGPANWPTVYDVETNWGQTFESLTRNDMEACVAEMQRQGAREVPAR